MVTRQIAVIRRRRLDHTLYPALFADLQLYRSAWRQWHRRWRALGAAEAPPR